MAGDWIKMRGNLWDDPRISKLCDATDSSEAAVVGALYWLWAAADQHTEDGAMPGLSLRQIDRKTGVLGFGQALCDIGWLQDHPEGVRIVNFEEHNGASAKRRGMEAQRKANARKVSAPNADKAQTESGQRAELEKEKSKSSTPLTPQRGRSSPVGIKSFLTDCRTSSVKPVPEDDPVFQYAEDVGIPDEFLRLAWREFVDRHLESSKRYRDWRKAFRNCVRGNWYKLWWAGPDGEYQLTTTGVQAQRKHQEAA